MDTVAYGYTRILDEWKELFHPIMAEMNNLIDRLDTFIDVYGVDKIHPHPNNIFKPFYKIRPDEVEIIFIGESPYVSLDKATGKRHATGLCFDIPKGIPLTPSLSRISSSLKKSIDLVDDRLEFLEDYGFLMLNAAMSIGTAGSNPMDPYSTDEKYKYVNEHKFLWRSVIKRVVTTITKRPSVVAMFGNEAQSFQQLIKPAKKRLPYIHPAARVTDNPYSRINIIQDIVSKAMELNFTPRITDIMNKQYI